MLQLNSWEANLLQRASEAESRFQLDSRLPSQSADSLNTAYRVCKAVTAKHSKSFYAASSLLPREKRQAIRALYAFCRTTDDIVDEAGGNAVQELARWRNKVERMQHTSDDLVALAWAETRVRYGVPHQYMVQLIDGVARDLEQTRYATFDELADYAYGVASTVGLMSMHIIGYVDKSALAYAIKLGVALQLTNILRDVGEDWRMGRVYLPADELAAFGLDETFLAQGRVDERWREFMRFQIDRNRKLYAEAATGIALLKRDGQRAVAAAADLYGGILHSIEANGFDVFTQRAYVSRFRKVRRLIRLWNPAPRLFVRQRASG